MKSLPAFGILALGLAVATATAAPSPMAPLRAAQRQQLFQRARQGVIAQKLNLTDEQKAQAKQIRLTAEATIRATRANPALAPEQRHALVASAVKTAQEPWRAVLTAGQQATLAELNSHPRMLDALARQRQQAILIGRQLGLTPAQQAKIRALRTQAVATAQPVRTDPGLPPAQKAARLRELSQASRQEIQGVLTPPQRTRLGKIRQHLLAPLAPLGG